MGALVVKVDAAVLARDHVIVNVQSNVVRRVRPDVLDHVTLLVAVAAQDAKETVTVVGLHVKLAVQITVKDVMVVADAKAVKAALILVVNPVLILV